MAGSAAIDDLKRERLVRASGSASTAGKPTNVLRALDDRARSTACRWSTTSSIRRRKTSCFPYCQAHDIAVIARVPFDEGSLTGTLTADSQWPEGDWRNLYFNPEHLAATLARVERLTPAVPEGMDLPELALRFILEHPAVSTTIPGMRQPGARRAQPGRQRRGSGCRPGLAGGALRPTAGTGRPNATP